MNHLLLKNRPKDISEEKFKEMWENSGYTLEALYKTIIEFIPKESITPKDFDKPAFVEKMIWGQAQKDFAEKVLTLFPKSLTGK